MHSSSLILALCCLAIISACSPSANRSSFAQPFRASNSNASQTEKGDESSPTAVVKSQKANLRDKPSRSGRVVTEVTRNDRLSLVTSSPVGPWYRVRESRMGAEGWIHGNLITLELANPSLPRTETSRPVKTAQPNTSERSYINVDGERVPSPVFRDSAPPGASARCRDGSYSFSRNRRGTCSHHGGVAQWL